MEVLEPQEIKNMATPRKNTINKSINMQTYADFIGREVKILNNGGYHQIGKVGDIVRITNIISVNTSNAIFSFVNFNNNGAGLCCSWTWFEPIANTLEALAGYEKALETKRTELEQQIEVVKAKKNYLAETGESELDEDVYEVYQTVKALDKDIPNLEKAKIIAKLTRR